MVSFLFEATVVLLAGANMAEYALMAARVRGTIRRASVRRVANRVGDSLSVGAAALMISARR